MSQIEFKSHPYETSLSHKKTPMTRERRQLMQHEQYRTLTREELDCLAGEPLPERAAMSLVNANLAVPVNLALAANVLSDGAVAYADAQQSVPITQGI